MDKIEISTSSDKEQHINLKNSIITER